MEKRYDDLLKQIEELKKQVEKFKTEESEKAESKIVEEKKKPSDSESAKKETDKRKQLAKREGYNWKGRIILIVEDNDAHYFYLHEVIKPTQAKLIWAKGGRTAVEICKSAENIDLVLMDIRIPNFDGFEATTKIKELRPGLPVIAQTAYSSPENKKRSMEVGCSEYLEKPINHNILLKVISKYLDV